jgi:hypothetical protein
MALNKTNLKENLLNIFNAMEKTQMSNSEYAGQISDVIDIYIKTATVTVKPGIAVTTPVGPGSTSAPGTGSLS